MISRTATFRTLVILTILSGPAFAADSQGGTETAAQNSKIAQTTSGAAIVDVPSKQTCDIPTVMSLSKIADQSQSVVTTSTTESTMNALLKQQNEYLSQQLQLQRLQAQQQAAQAEEMRSQISAMRNQMEAQTQQQATDQRRMRRQLFWQNLGQSFR